MSPLRRYLALISDEFEERPPCTWGEMSVPAWTRSNVQDPRGVIDGAPFALVETSEYGQTWITLHTDPHVAVRYHTEQEAAEDWTLRRLVDLRNGDEYELGYTARRVAEPDLAFRAWCSARKS